MEYVCINANLDNNNFSVFSNMSVYGGLKVGQKGPKFAVNNERVMQEARELAAKGYRISYTRYPLDESDIKMLKECGAI